MVDKLKNVAWLLLGGIALFWAVTTFVGVVFGGDLDPPGPPGPTMKTLDEIPPSWHQKLAADDGAPGPNPPAGCNSSRFKCVLDDEAVLDLETGLVWDRSPDTGTSAWYAAVANCTNREVGGRKGWRLPTAAELGTLVDATQAAPALPSGHPFINVQNAIYWTATTDAGSTTRARAVAFNVGITYYVFPKTTNYNWWCVRGATGGYDGGH